MSKRLEDAAIAWWEQRRPLRWTLNQHLRYPDVGVYTKSGEALAKEVARLVRSRIKRGRPKR